VSDDGATAVPPPYVLDVGVVIAVARGDTRIMTLAQNLDAAGRPVIVPALVITGSSLDMRGDEASDLIG